MELKQGLPGQSIKLMQGGRELTDKETPNPANGNFFIVSDVRSLGATII